MNANPRAIGATQDDLPGVIKLVDDVMRRGYAQSMLTDYPLVYEEENLDNISIIKQDGRIVAEVPYLAHWIEHTNCRFRIGIISPTATDPRYRRRGLGRRCLTRGIEKMTSHGTELSVLWTLVSTFPFYECHDFQAIRSQVVVFDLNLLADPQLFADHGLKISKATGSDEEFTAIQSIHEQEECGTTRPKTAYRALFSLPGSTTLLARDKGGQILGYLLISVSVNKPGIVEGGGELPVLETLVRVALLEHLCYWHHEDPLPVYDYLSGSRLGDLMRAKVPERQRPWNDHQMIRINRPRALFEALRNWFAHRNGGRKWEFSVQVTDDDDTAISFHFDASGLELGRQKCRDHLECTRRELTSILFGEHLSCRVKIPDKWVGLTPYYFPIWILDHS